MKKPSLAWALVIGLFLAFAGALTPTRAQSGAPTYHPLAQAWGVGSLTSGATVFGTPLVATQPVSVLRIGVVLGSGVPISIRETDGTTTVTTPLNGGSNLAAGCAYTFVWESRCKVPPGGVTPGPSSFNFVVGGPTTVPILRVTECTSGVD